MKGAHTLSLSFVTIAKTAVAVAAVAVVAAGLATRGGPTQTPAVAVTVTTTPSEADLGKEAPPGFEPQPTPGADWSTGEPEVLPPAAGTPVVKQPPDVSVEPHGFGIEGVVLGAPGGAPIAGATITAEDLGSTVSGDDGSFALLLDNFSAVRQERYELARGRELVVGRLSFVIEAPGYAPWTIRDLDVYPDEGLTSFTPLLGQEPVTLDYGCTPVPVRAAKEGCHNTSLQQRSQLPVVANAGSASPPALNACQTDTVSYVTPPDTIRV